MKYLLAIAIEQYSDPHVPKVPYAINDVREIEKAFVALGFDKVTVLVNEKATRTSVESQVRKMRDQLEDGDEVVFYFAGHGLAVGAENRLVLWDSVRSEPKQTTLPLQWVFDQLRQSTCGKVLLLLDACHSGLLADSTMRGAPTIMSDEAIEAELKDSEFFAGFASCKVEQISSSSRTLKHGIWTFHFLEALRGKVPALLDSKNRLLSVPLQRHLRETVKRTVNDTYDDGRVQTPWVFGAGLSTLFVVADLTPIIAARKASVTSSSIRLQDVSFSVAERVSIKNLQGFKSHHRVFNEHSGATRGFVENVGTADVEDRLKDLYGQVRDSFAFKRLELKCTPVDNGGGAVETPKFSIGVSVSQADDDARDAMLKTCLYKLKDLSKEEWANLDELFGESFASIELSLSSSADIEGIVDYLEAKPIDEVTLGDYDPECTHCELTVLGYDVVITEYEFLLHNPGGKAPQELLEALKRVIKALKPLVQASVLVLED